MIKSVRMFIWKLPIGKRLRDRYYVMRRRYNLMRSGKNETELPVVADLGGVGKNQIKEMPGWGIVKVMTVNLYDEADLVDDAAKLGKIEDASLEGIYSSHLIEHFWWWETDDVLKLWLRKLKPRGRIEIRCPDMEYIFRKWHENRNDKKINFVWEDIVFHNVYGAAVEPWHRFYKEEGQRHRNLMTEDRLTEALEHAGFGRIKRVHYSKDYLDRWPYDLRYKEFHGKIIIQDLVMEGFKEG